MIQISSLILSSIVNYKYFYTLFTSLLSHANANCIMQMCCRYVCPAHLLPITSTWWREREWHGPLWNDDVKPAENVSSSTVTLHCTASECKLWQRSYKRILLSKFRLSINHFRAFPNHIHFYFCFRFFGILPAIDRPPPPPFSLLAVWSDKTWPFAPWTTRSLFFLSCSHSPEQLPPILLRYNLYIHSFRLIFIFTDSDATTCHCCCVLRVYAYTARSSSQASQVTD